MPVTLAQLERVVADLKMAELFSFSEPMNEGHSFFDVFPEVEDPEAFEPTDAGSADQFLMWTAAASARAFDEEGVLRSALPMWWGGSFARLQNAFARVGLVVRIDRDETAREPYGESGRLVLGPGSADTKTDLLTLLATCDALQERGVIALGCSGYTQSDGWSDVATQAAEMGDEDEERTSMFWTEQKHDAFDAVGNLASVLMLHWRGDSSSIITALREAGLVVEDMADEDTCIGVVSGSPPPVYLETFEEAAALDQVASRSVRPRVHAPEVGPLSLVGSGRSKDVNSVRKVAFDPSRPTRIAFAQGLDGRGFPQAPAYFIDLEADGAVTALPTKESAMGVGGLFVLRDGRALWCTTEMRKIDDDKPYGTSCAVLRVDGAEVLVRGYEHISETQLLDVDASERFAVLGEPTGASVFTIPKPGEPWPEPQRLAIPDEPVRAYTRTAISPDAKRVAWGDDSYAPLACFDRETGALLWRHETAMNNGGLVFSPDSRMLAMVHARGGLSFFSAEDGQRVVGDLSTTGALSFAFHPDGTSFVTGRANGVVRVHDLASNLSGDVRVLDVGKVTCVGFTADGAHLAVGGEKGDVALFAWRGLGALADLPPLDENALESTPILAQKGRSPLVGATGRIVSGTFHGHEVVVRAVGSGGTKLRVELASFGNPQVVVDRDAFRTEDELDQVSADSPFQPDDLVFVHGGYQERGENRRVLTVDEAGRQVVIEIPSEDEEDDDTVEAILSFDDVTLVSPLRRLPLPMYVEALERVRHRFGHQAVLHAWALRALEAVDWDADHPSLVSDGELAREFQALEERAWAEAEQSHEARVASLTERLDPLEPDQQVEAWQRDWAEWVDWQAMPQPAFPEFDALRSLDDDERHRRIRLAGDLRERFSHHPW